MNLTNLYEKLNKEKIKVTNWKMKNAKARIINDESAEIFLDYSKIHSYIEEKETVAEECGHYYNDAYYTLLSDQNYIRKQEYKANKWKATHLCPLKSILRCVKKRKDN